MVPVLEANHEYCRDAVLAAVRARGGGAQKALDYGCGAGQVVGALCHCGVDAFGCDVFYAGGSHLENVERSPLFQEGRIRPMTGSRAEFDEGTFDVVFSNQVLEHVVDLDETLDEMARVLKPGGLVLSLFPDRAIWREGHCGIPFVHWFPKGSRLRVRVRYTLAFAALGFGYNREGKGRRQWARDICQWLDDWTYYRRLEDIHTSFGRRFESIRHVEHEYLTFRMARSRVAALIPVFKIPGGARVGAWVVRKGMGLISSSGRRNRSESCERAERRARRAHALPRRPTDRQRLRPRALRKSRNSLSVPSRIAASE